MVVGNPKRVDLPRFARLTKEINNPVKSSPKATYSLNPVSVFSRNCGSKIKSTAQITYPAIFPE